MVVQVRDAQLDRMFRALADGTRRDILRRTSAGPLTVSRLADDYAMSFAAVQKHVASLEKAGLVEKEAVGRERRVRAVAKQIARARACLEQLEALWRSRMTALDTILSESKE